MSIQTRAKNIIQALDISCGVSINSEKVCVNDENDCYCDEEVLLNDCDKNDTAENLTERRKSHSHGVV